jgi:hypothetical protein
MAKFKIKIYSMYFGYLNIDHWNLFGICDLVIGI